MREQLARKRANRIPNKRCNFYGSYAAFALSSAADPLAVEATRDKYGRRVSFVRALSRLSKSKSPYHLDLPLIGHE